MAKEKKMYRLTSGSHSRWEGPKDAGQRVVYKSVTAAGGGPVLDMIEMTEEEASALEGRVVPVGAKVVMDGAVREEESDVVKNRPLGEGAESKSTKK